MTLSIAEIMHLERQGLKLVEGFFYPHCMKLFSSIQCCWPPTTFLSHHLMQGFHWPTPSTFFYYFSVLLILIKDVRIGPSLFWALLFSYSTVSLWLASYSHCFKYYLCYICSQICLWVTPPFWVPDLFIQMKMYHFNLTYLTLLNVMLGKSLISLCLSSLSIKEGKC